MLSSVKFINAFTKPLLYQLDPLQSLVCLTFVRWRKRRWMPKSATKYYYVRTPTPIDPVEYQELRTKYQHHNSYMKGLRILLRKQHHEVIKEKKDVKYEIQDQEDWQRRLVTNSIWNEETMKLRETRQSIELEERTLQKNKQLLELEEKENLRLQKAEQIIQQEKDAIQYAVTEDNMESEIEKVLNQRKNYNYVITLDGKKLYEQADGSISPPNKDVQSQKHV